MKGGGIISVTLGKLGKPPEETEASEKDEPESEAAGMSFLSASDEVFDAIKEGDKGRFSEALKNAIESCIMDWEDREDTGEHEGEGEDKGESKGY